MNREMKRMQKRQGLVGPDGTPVAPSRQQMAARAAESRPRKRVGVIGFLKEVRAEMRKVIWPTRKEVQNYSAIVLCALLFMMALIAVLDFGVSKASVHLFQ